MRKIFFLLFFFIFSFGFSQTDLNPGDLALTTINADGEDDFSFVAFVDLAIGTEIKFTDEGWDVVMGDFGTASEGTIIWTATSLVTAGSEVQINSATSSVGASTGNVTKTGAFNLSGGGDQILVYQGLDSNPEFIYAFSHRVGGFQATTIGSSSLNTGLPSGLTSGENALAVATHHDNWQFICSSSIESTPENLLGLFMAVNSYNTSSSVAFDNGAFNETGCSFAIGTLGVGENSLLNDSISFKNPVNEILEISENVLIDNIEIYNISGVLVVSGKTNSVNVSRLESGIYLAKITSNGVIVSKKIVKN